MAPAPIRPVFYEGGQLQLLDQRALPQEEKYLSCADEHAVERAIKDMVVRGAPAIGISAAYGMALAMKRIDTLPPLVRAPAIREAATLLEGARPTAVNLAWAVRRMERVMSTLPEGSSRAAAALAEANRILEEDIAACKMIGKLGAALIPDGATVLTHCNAGALATGGYGTALGVIRAAVEAGKKIKVIADETRPYLQGARLTAWELLREGIDVTLISDSMAGHLLARGEITVAVVGADRIARNGDTANKIGTYPLSVLCREHGVPFIVAAPLSTIDLALPDGMAIPIEERAGSEVTCLLGQEIAPKGVKARHPAFDVTPAKFISAVVTEQGIARAPFQTSLAELFSGF